jgi:hypothetical protein
MEGTPMSDDTLEKLKEILKFGKFGFKGTLASGLAGMTLVLLLALLDAFTEFNISDLGLVGIGTLVLVGTVSFGYFSLRKLPQINFSFQDGQIVASVSKSGKSKLAKEHPKTQP